MACGPQLQTILPKPPVFQGLTSKLAARPFETVFVCSVTREGCHLSSLGQYFSQNSRMFNLEKHSKSWHNLIFPDGKTEAK